MHKIKLTRPIPKLCADKATEAIEGLRSALDQIGYAAAFAAGNDKPKKTSFPIGDDPSGLDDVIRRGGSKDLPPEILALFRGFRPYETGNHPIWALNKLRNRGNHAILVPVFTAVDGVGIEIEVLLGPANIMPKPFIWDSKKDELVYLTVGRGGSAQYKLKVSLSIALGEVRGSSSSPLPINALNVMAQEVEAIIRATEAECRRRGYIRRVT